MLPDDIRDYRIQCSLIDSAGMIIRAIRPTDKQALVDGLKRQSAETLYMRFLGLKHHLSPKELHYLTEVDFDRHVALVAGLLEGDEELPVGVGRYVVDSENPLSAEVAIIVDEGQHGRGVGTQLLKHLCYIAQKRGLHRLTGTVLKHNRKMLEVLENVGIPMYCRPEGHALKVFLDLRKGEIQF